MKDLSRPSFGRPSTVGVGLIQRVASLARRASGFGLTRVAALAGCAILISLASLVLPSGQAQGTPSSWSITPSWNNGDGENSAYIQFSSVSCMAAGECFAVGSHAIGGTGGSLIEQWSGSSWNAVQSPNPGHFNKLGSAELYGVDCPSSTFCVAVGDYETAKKDDLQTLVETWNGTQWKVRSSPNVSSFDDTLNAVSCASPKYCVAIGSWPDGNARDNRSELFAESWNGDSWSIAHTPLNPGSASNRLSSISCTTNRICEAVGAYSDSAQPGWFKTLVETYREGGWTSPPSPHPSRSSGLYGISCLSSSECTAVGYHSSDTLVLNWDGKQWATVSSPNQEIGGENYLNSLAGVSCTNENNCVAVGHYLNEDGTSLTLVESWNGSAWSIIPSPDVASQDNYSNSLVGISCTGATSCLAVGSTASGGDQDGDQTLAEIWDGAIWTISTSPNPGVENYLTSVSCVTSTDCVAVGHFLSLTPESDLVETWDGAAWSVASTPNFADGSGPSLDGVSCSSSSSCVAVGSESNSGQSSTLVESWNGTDWSTVSSPSPGASSNVLNAVSCTSSTYCVAVGTDASSGSLQTLVETWDGTSWSVASSPNVGTGDNSLLGVSCVDSSDFCVAAGYDLNSSNIGEPLVETWNGTEWSVASTPDPNGDFNPLTAVSCSDAADCVAVGRYDETGTGYQTLAEVWNGTGWSITPTPDESGYNALDAVSCDGPTDCVAVGNYYTSTNSQNEIEDWNGSVWSSAPSTQEESSSLDGVSCTDSADCVAVGDYDVGDGYTVYPYGSASVDTLIETGSDS